MIFDKIEKKTDAFVMRQRPVGNILLFGLLLIISLSFFYGIGFDLFICVITIVGLILLYIFSISLGWNARIILNQTGVYKNSKLKFRWNDVIRIRQELGLCKAGVFVFDLPRGYFVIEVVNSKRIDILLELCPKNLQEMIINILNYDG